MINIDEIRNHNYYKINNEVVQLIIDESLVIKFKWQKGGAIKPLSEIDVSTIKEIPISKEWIIDLFDMKLEHLKFHNGSSPYSREVYGQCVTTGSDFDDFEFHPCGWDTPRGYTRGNIELHFVHQLQILYRQKFGVDELTIKRLWLVEKA